jgi:hypothetical protein
MTTTTNHDALVSARDAAWYAWRDADQAFHNALVAQFTAKWAGTMRYRPGSWVPSVRVAWERVEQARIVYTQAQSALVKP